MTYNSIGSYINTETDTKLFLAFSYEDAYYLFFYREAFMVLVINPITKESKWVTNLKEAAEFYEKV